MDCLDRTNFAQTKIYLLSLQTQLEELGLDLATIYTEKEFVELGLAFTEIAREKPLVNLINSFWADNGDFISLHYTGTNSTITRVMKEGKKGFLSAINHKYQDVARFVNNNFTDNFKEGCIRMILARSVRSNFFSNREDCDIDDKFPNISLTVITWNVGNGKVDSIDDLKQVLFSKYDISNSDIIVFNLQEIVKLNASFVLRKNKNNESIVNWISMISTCIGNDFFLVNHKALVGLLLVVFVKKSLKPNIREVCMSEKKLGF